MGKEKAAPVGSRAAAWYQRLLNTNFEESGSEIVVTFGPEIKENPDAAAVDYTKRSTAEDLIAEYGQQLQEAACRRLDSLRCPEPERQQNQ